MQDLVAQRYLIYEPVRQVVDDDRDKLYEFRWGIRAHSEVSNEKILRHVSEVKLFCNSFCIVIFLILCKFFFQNFFEVV